MNENGNRAAVTMISDGDRSLLFARKMRKSVSIIVQTIHGSGRINIVTPKKTHKQANGEPKSSIKKFPSCDCRFLLFAKRDRFNKLLSCRALLHIRTRKLGPVEILKVCTMSRNNLLSNVGTRRLASSTPSFVRSV